MTDRTNADWLAQLASTGTAADAAVADLRALIRRGLGRSLAGRAGADDALLEDLTQEATLKVLAGLASFRGDSRFTTWALTIAMRVAFTELRRARWKEVSLDQLAQDVPSRAEPQVPEPAAQAAVLAVMRQVLDTDLTERQRTVLMAELRGMPQAELAAQLGLNRNALYKLAHDARQKLKRGLEAAGVTGDEVREAFDL